MKNKTRRSFLYPLALSAMLTAAAITGLAQSPSVVTRPASQAVPQGGTASFTISTSGALPITYTWRWYKNNQPSILYYQEALDSTNCTIVLTNLQPSDAGFFNIDIQNSSGFGPGSQVALGVISSGMETNGFALTVYGLTNSVWTVNCTTNLAQSDWFTLTNFSIPHNPRFVKFVDLEATNLNRFYQVIPFVE